LVGGFENQQLRQLVVSLVVSATSGFENWWFCCWFLQLFASASGGFVNWFKNYSDNWWFFWRV
jgi:hypothetical protein